MKKNATMRIAKEATIKVNTRGSDDYITSVEINGKRIPAKAVDALAEFLQRNVLGN